MFIQSLQNYWQLIVYKLPQLFIALLTLGLFWIGAKVINIYLNRLFSKFKILIKEKTVVNYIVKLVTLGIGIIVALSILGVNLTALVTGVGLTGLILGFALQDIIKNFLSGILILIQKPFQVGDKISIDEYRGKIKKINSRYTILRTFEGKDVLIPNQLILNKTLVYFPPSLRKRSDFILYITDNNSIKRAAEKGLEALTQTPGIIPKPAPKVCVEKIERGYIVLKFFFWWTRWQAKGEILPVKSLAIKNVKEKFDREGITLAH